MMKLKALCLLLAAAAVAPCASWDTSGNGLLNGTYYFREVFYVLADTQGDLSQVFAVFGTMTFNGTGSYTMNATGIQCGQNGCGSGTVTSPGTYSVAASGHGFISNPISCSTAGCDQIYGTVSAQGIFVGSSTENGFFNDMFVAAPVASPAPSVASAFSGTYTFADLDLSSGSPASALDSMFSVSSSGNGTLGTVTATGYIAAYGSTLVNQAAVGVTYQVSNGAVVMNFPNNSNATLIAGQKYLYMSKDGNFLFGGSPTSFDMIVGVKTGGTSLTLSGLYHQAGIDEDVSQGYGLLDAYYGAFSAVNGKIVSHQRVNNVVFNPTSSDYTFSDSYNVGSAGTYSGTAARYVVGAGGAIRIGSGIGPLLGISVALQAPAVTGTGVFLNPQGVVNAGSWSPYTAGIAPGELITLVGTNLAAHTVVAQGGVPFQTTVDSVQVSIGGLPAPIYYVSATQLSVIVPYAVTGPVVPITVTNNGTVSNTVTMYLNATAPGVLTQTANGLGYGDFVHANGTLVTASNPAKMGETVQLFLTGLGAVSPTITDGGLGSSDPSALNQTPTGVISSYVGGVSATVVFSGLAPTLAGLYQMNLTIPTGLTAGDNYVDISGSDAYTSQALIPVVAASTSEVARTEAPVVSGRTAKRQMHAPPACVIGQACKGKAPSGR